MKRIKSHRSLVLAALLVPFVAAQGAGGQAPRATVRDLAVVEGYVDAFAGGPGGRFVIFEVNDSTFTYDVATRRRTFLGTNMQPAMVSPQGDRLAFARPTEDQSGARLWTVPLDPRTGTATDRAQVVSQRLMGGRALFSRDGRRLAFWAISSQPAGTWDLTLVPSTGGPERVVENLPGVHKFNWSADGTALDVEVFTSRTAIERTTLATGAKQPLFPLTLWTSQMPVGISSDTRVAIYTGNPDIFMYRTAEGAEGEIDVPLPSLDDAWGHDFSIDAQDRYLTATFALRNQGVRVLDVATGSTRAVLPNESSLRPAWSPDGSRLAVLTGHLSHYDIAVMNPDGSGVRRYPVPQTLAYCCGADHGYGEPWLDRPWSPDGRYLAFTAVDGPRVGWAPTRRHTVTILDLDSGTTRELASISGRYEAVEWRSDGRAVRAIQIESPSQHWSLVEIDLAGSEKTLRDLSAEFPALIGATLNESTAVIGVKVDQRMDRYLIPLEGGMARLLPDPGLENGNAATAVGGVKGGRMVLPIGNAVGGYPVLRVISTTGEPTRTVSAPRTGSLNGNVFPDGRQVAVTGKNPNDPLYKLYVVSLEDGSPRMIADIEGGGTGGHLAPAPDGRFVAYTTDGAWTSTIHEIDFGPALLTILRR